MFNVKYEDENTEKELKETKKKIIVVSHSIPFADGLIIHKILERLRIDHKIYSRYMWFLTPEWCIDVKPGGFVKQQIEELKDKEEVCRVLFPSGGTIKWKTGYKYIAEGIDAKIFGMGIDYTKMNVCVYSGENVKMKLGQVPICWFGKLMRLFGYGCQAFI